MALLWCRSFSPSIAKGRASALYVRAWTKGGGCEPPRGSGILMCLVWGELHPQLCPRLKLCSLAWGHVAGAFLWRALWQRRDPAAVVKGQHLADATGLEGSQREIQFGGGGAHLSFQAMSQSRPCSLAKASEPLSGRSAAMKADTLPRAPLLLQSFHSAPEEVVGIGQRLAAMQRHSLRLDGLEGAQRMGMGKD